MLRVLFVAFVAAVVAVNASTAAVEHDAVIAEFATEMPEHAAAFAELSAAAGTDDVFTVLDAISSNVKAERKHARAFYKSYKKTTERDLAKYKILIAKLKRSEHRARGRTAAERHEIKQLRRNVNANVRHLSRAVARFQHVQNEKKRTTHKKKSAMRHLNNKIADRKVYRKVLRLISKALKQNDKPASARFLEALSVAHEHGLSHDAAPVFLQLSAEDESESEEAVEQTTDTTDEVEADAEVDESAFELDAAPSAEDLALIEESEEDADADEEEADEEEEEAVEESAEDALDAAADAEDEEADEAESEEESEEEADAEAEADAEDEVDDASEARMMQVLQTLATGAQDDGSVAELITLIDSLVADVNASIASAKKRKIAVLAKYMAQMKTLQALAGSIKSTVRRLQTTVQTGKARLAELSQTSHSVDANTKEVDAQLNAYRAMRKGIRANWAKYEARYRKNQARRDSTLTRLAELKRRLAAVERASGALNVDLSKVQLRYRWKAGPFGGCKAACGPSTRARKVRCVSFSGKPVKHHFCDGQKKPKAEVKCQKKLCPSDCVVSSWKPRGKCSNQCGSGVRLHTRHVVEPARFGGRCPQQFRLTKHKACKSLKKCAAGQSPTDSSAADAAKAKAASADRRARREARAAAAAAKAAPFLTEKQKKKRAKARRCVKCPKGRAGKKCRFHNCLNKAQKQACKACAKGPDGHECRIAKCRDVAAARQKKARKAIKARKAAKKAAKKAAAAARKNGVTLTEKQKKKRAKNKRCAKCPKGRAGKKCRFHNCLNKAQKQACKACAKGPDGHECRIAKCRDVAAARQKKVRKAIKARKAAKKAAKKAARAVKAAASPKKHHRRCLARCAEGKKGRKCRRVCRKAKAARKASRDEAKSVRAVKSKHNSVKRRRNALKRMERQQREERRRLRSSLKQAQRKDADVAAGLKRRAFWYRPRNLKSESGEGSAVTVWADHSRHHRDLVPVGPSAAPTLKTAPIGGANTRPRKSASFNRAGLQSKDSVKLGDKFDVVAVLRFDGDPHKPANRWGAASAFMVNAPGATPADEYTHGVSGGIGVAVTDGQLRLIAEGRSWGAGGADVVAGQTYIVRLRRTSPTKFRMYVGAPVVAPNAEGHNRIVPAATLETDIVESPDARVKLGVSDALYFGWEGRIAEVIGFNHLLSRAEVQELYERLAEKYHL